MFFDKLFDSFNESKKDTINSIITDKSDHVMFCKATLCTLIVSSMEFVEKTSHKTIRHNRAKCINNWILTIQGALEL